MSDITEAHRKEAELEARVKDELDAIDMDARYREMLDDCYSLESVGGPFAHMSAARVLEEVDEVAYRCGYNDWIDGESRDGDIEEIDGEWYDAREVQKIRDEVEA